MEKQRRVFRAIKSEVDRTDLNVDYDTLYVISDDGEMVPVATAFGEEADNAIRKIQNSVKKDVTYLMMYQETLLDLAKNLSGAELRVIIWMVGSMKYDNFVYGATLRGIAKEINAGVNTVREAVNKLKKLNLIRETGKGVKKVVHLNPSIGWKGTWYKKKQKVDMFCQDEETNEIKNKQDERRGTSDSTD